MRSAEGTACQGEGTEGAMALSKDPVPFEEQQGAHGAGAE